MVCWDNGRYVAVLSLEPAGMSTRKILATLMERVLYYTWLVTPLSGDRRWVYNLRGVA